jgi:hypothetical protein
MFVWEIEYTTISVVSQYFLDYEFSFEIFYVLYEAIGEEVVERFSFELAHASCPTVPVVNTQS